MAGFGYLLYVYPEQSKKLHEKFPIVVHLKKLNGQPEKAAAKIAQTSEILEGKIPPSSPDCEFCRYQEAVREAVE